MSLRVLIFLLTFFTSAQSFAYTVFTKETYTRIYEFGEVVEEDEGKFEADYEVDEMNREIKLTRLEYVGKKMQQIVSKVNPDVGLYNILNIQNVERKLYPDDPRQPIKSQGFPKIITASGDKGWLVLGDNFFFTTQSAGGQVYVGSGTAQRID